MPGNNSTMAKVLRKALLDKTTLLWFLTEQGMQWQSHTVRLQTPGLNFQAA